MNGTSIRYRIKRIEKEIGQQSIPPMAIGRVFDGPDGVPVIDLSVKGAPSKEEEERLELEARKYWEERAKKKKPGDNWFFAGGPRNPLLLNFGNGLPNEVLPAKKPHEMP